MEVLRYKMKRKRILIAIAVALVLSIILFLIRSTMRSNIKLKTYKKYEVSILVNSFKESKSESTSIRFRYDGENGKIIHEDGQIEAFLIGDKLQYLKGETIYTYVPKQFYDDLDEILVRNIKRADFLESTGDYKNYSTVFDLKVMNRVLTALCFDRKTGSNSVVKFSILDDHISTMNMSILDIEGYDRVDIMLHFEKLNYDFKINTSKIEGNKNRPYKRENSKENIFSIIR